MNKIYHFDSMLLSSMFLNKITALRLCSFTVEKFKIFCFGLQYKKKRNIYVLYTLLKTLFKLRILKIY